MMTVNIALRRQVHQLSYYTDGATPDLVFGVPDSWQPGQIAEFEEYWNGLLAGNLAERRRARFIPGAMKPFDTKEHALKDDYDEWLARIVCYAFSVSAHPFIRDQTRATSTTSHSTALAEGLLPVAEWVRSLMNRLLAGVLEAPGVYFAWDSDEANAQEQATIDVAYVGAAILTADEVRARLGLGPLGKVKVPSIQKKRILSKIHVKKYNPEQPRQPAGSSEGGEWANNNSGSEFGISGQSSIVSAESHTVKDPTSEVEVAAFDEKWQACHDICAPRFVGKGYLDSHARYRRCMHECLPSETDS